MRLDKNSWARSTVRAVGGAPTARTQEPTWGLSVPNAAHNVDRRNHKIAHPLQRKKNLRIINSRKREQSKKWESKPFHCELSYFPGFRTIYIPTYAENVVSKSIEDVYFLVGFSGLGSSQRFDPHFNALVYIKMIVQIVVPYTWEVIQRQFLRTLHPKL